MRTKKEEIKNQIVRSFVGQLIETKFVSFGDTYAQELTIKSGNQKIKAIYPFVKVHSFKENEILRWNVLEKSRIEVFYQVLNPEPENKKKVASMKKIWKDVSSVKITLDFDGGHSLEFSKNKIIPYERKAKRVQYFELVQMELPIEFWTTKIKK
jgi:hypothetical protein